MNLIEDSDRYFIIIDQGNTLTKIALFKETEIQYIKYYEFLTKAEISDFTLDLPISKEKIVAGIVSSVAGGEINVTELMPEIKWLIFDESTQLPVTNNYSSKSTLGKDRISGVIAAANMFPARNLLVIDAGTAITYDIITAGGEYIGGSISPGLSMRFNALNKFTGRLPLLKPENTEALTGIDTNTSILTGVMNGALFEAEGFIGKYQSEFDNLITLITGGDTKYFDKIIKSNIFAHQNLVLSGLNLILLYNLEKDQ